MLIILVSEFVYYDGVFRLVLCFEDIRVERIFFFERKEIVRLFKMLFKF